MIETKKLGGEEAIQLKIKNAGDWTAWITKEEQIIMVIRGHLTPADYEGRARWIMIDDTAGGATLDTKVRAIAAIGFALERSTGHKILSLGALQAISLTPSYK